MIRRYILDRLREYKPAAPVYWTIRDVYGLILVDIAHNVNAKTLRMLTICGRLASTAPINRPQRIAFILY